MYVWARDDHFKICYSDRNGIAVNDVAAVVPMKQGEKSVDAVKLLASKIAAVDVMFDSLLWAERQLAHVDTPQARVALEHVRFALDTADGGAP